MQQKLTKNIVAVTVAQNHREVLLPTVDPPMYDAVFDFDPLHLTSASDAFFHDPTRKLFLGEVESVILNNLDELAPFSFVSNFKNTFGDVVSELMLDQARDFSQQVLRYWPCDVHFSVTKKHLYDPRAVPVSCEVAHTLNTGSAHELRTLEWEKLDGFLYHVVPVLMFCERENFVVQ